MPTKTIKTFEINLTGIKVGIIEIKAGVQIPLEVHQLSSQRGGFSVLTDGLHLLAFEAGQRFVQPIQIAMFNNEFGGGLGPNPGHARNVVGGVTHQCQDVPHHVGFHAFRLEHIGWGDQRILHRIKHVDPRRAQLREIFVATGNADGQLRVVRSALGDDRGNGVVGLHPFKTKHRNTHQTQQFQTPFHLWTEIFRGFISVGFVFGIQLCAEGFGIPRRIDHHHQLRGLMGANHVEQGSGEAVHQMGRLPRHRTGHASTDRVIRPEEGRVAVNNPKSVHSLMLFGARQPRSADQDQSGLFKPNRIHHHCPVVLQGD